MAVDPQRARESIELPRYSIYAFSVEPLHSNRLGIVAILLVSIGVGVLLSGRLNGDRDHPSAMDERSVAETVNHSASAGDLATRPYSTDLSDSAPDTSGDLRNKKPSLPVIDFAAITGGQQILDMFGSDRDWAAWARSRGMNPEWLELQASPYAALTIDELEELVAQGDTAAKLALARQLRGKDTPAALDMLYQLTMEDSSIEAMAEMSSLYGGIDHVVTDRNVEAISPELEATLKSMAGKGMDAELENMAWGLLYDSYAGFPRSMGQPVEGDLMTRFKQACDRAVLLREAIESQAAERGQPMPSIEPAPFGFTSITEQGPIMLACPGERLPEPDFTGCQPVLFFVDGHYIDGFVCP